MIGSFKQEFRRLKRGLIFLAVPAKFRDLALLALKSRRWPNFANPSTFTEKLHYRKYHETDSRLVQLSDKNKVRDYVRMVLGEECLIPCLFVGDSITPEKLIALGGNIVVKKNNDSGSIQIIRNPINQLAAEKICETLNRDNVYGRNTLELWYTQIPSLIIVEPLLPGPKPDRLPIDYKFHMFQQNEGESPFILIEVIERDGSGNIVARACDQDGKPMVSKSGKEIRYLGSEPFKGPFPATSEQLSEMRRIATALSEPFNFVRIDLYLVEGKVFFGEMTFCPSEGRCCFNDPEFDQFLGDQWVGPLLIAQN